MAHSVEVCPQEVDLAFLLQESRPELQVQLLLPEDQLEIAISVVLLCLLWHDLVKILVSGCAVTNAM